MGSKEVKTVPSSGRCLARRQKLPCLLAEFLNTHGAAAVLDEEVEARGGAEARKRRDVEREDDGLRDSRELPLQTRHDSLHVQRLPVPLLPRMQPRKERAIVRLVSVGDHAIAANRLERFNTFGLGQDVLNLFQYRAGALERGARRELDVDPEDPLILVRDEPGRQHLPEEAGPHRHAGHKNDCEERTTHEQASRAYVAGCAHFKDFVESPEESS